MKISKKGGKIKEIIWKMSVLSVFTIQNRGFYFSKTNISKIEDDIIVFMGGLAFYISYEFILSRPSIIERTRRCLPFIR